jgi:hypothetical protein
MRYKTLRALRRGAFERVLSVANSPKNSKNFPETTVTVVVVAVVIKEDCERAKIATTDDERMERYSNAA